MREMTHEQFGHQMDRLKSQWPNSFGDERVKMIYSFVKTLDSRFWKTIVDKVLSDYKFAPLPAEIANEARRFSNKGTFNANVVVRCAECSDSSWTVVGGEGVPDVRRCHCFR